jgi:hypothetical protein
VASYVDDDVTSYMDDDMASYVDDDVASYVDDDVAPCKDNDVARRGKKFKPNRFKFWPTLAHFRIIFQHNSSKISPSSPIYLRVHFFQPMYQIK